MYVLRAMFYYWNTYHYINIYYLRSMDLRSIEDALFNDMSHVIIDVIISF